MANLPMVWTQHLQDKEAKERFESTLRNNSTVHKRLVDILLEWELEALRTKGKSYDKSSWAYHQAHKNGRAEALREVIDLFNFMENR